MKPEKCPNVNNTERNCTMKKIIVLIWIISTFISLVGCSSINNSEAPLPTSSSSKEINSDSKEPNSPNLPTTPDDTTEPEHPSKNDDDSYTVCLGDSDQLLDFFSLDFTNTSKLEAYIERYKDVKPTYYRFQNTEQILQVYNQLRSAVAPLCNNYSLSFNFTFFYDKPYYDSYDDLEIIDMETTYIWTNESRSKSYGFSLGKKIDDNDNYVDYKKRHTGYEPELLYQTEDQKIQVYTATLPEGLTKKAVWYTIVVDRQIIGLSYRDLDTESVRDYPIELLLENIEFLPFEDVKWSDIIH